MEFGRVPTRQLNKLDLSLPPDPLKNKRHLKGKAARSPGLYMGCAKWGRPEWVGTLYPAKTREKDFLSLYVKHYNAIELNATHYKLYDAEVTAKWAAQAKGSDCRFCPKMYKGISHFGNLSTKERMTLDFLRGTEGLGKHLGPIFIQLSDRFSPKRLDELISYLEKLPATHEYFIEVRHPAWFETDGGEGLFNHLDRLKMGAVITDAAGRRDCVHMRLTTNKTFIRFVGNSLHKTDYQRCDEWIERLGNWYGRGLKETWFFMHMHDEARSPRLTQYFAEQVNKYLPLKLQEPLNTAR